MKTNPQSPTGIARRLRRLLAVAALCNLAAPVAAQNPKVTASHSNYLPGEDIAISFSDGSGNPKDWIGIYPAAATPGPGSTLWLYVDGTETGTTGYRAGSVVFPGGLQLAGEWRAWLLANDDYVPASPTAFAAFNVIDPFSAYIRPDRRSYAPGQPITIGFTNNLANPKDWIGIYPDGVTPGSGTGATLWQYTDGTQLGQTGATEGSVAFPAGLPALGAYVAYLFANDGYEALASESFDVATSSVIILSVSPENNSTDVSPAPQYTAQIRQGQAKVVLSSVALTLDGVPVTAQTSVQDDVVTVTYQTGTLFGPGSQHAYRLAFDDTATPPNHVTSDTTFTVVAYQEIALPAPLFFENFDATPEDQVPPGWVRVNYTDITTPDFDLGNLDSASFADWTVLDADRFRGEFVTYSDPGAPRADKEDYHRVLTPNARFVVNGQLVTDFATGRLAFANSGYRNGAAQVQYLDSPDIDCRGKTDIYLAFHSLWEQNQDNIAALEYSTDRGQTWLPIAYLIETADVILDGQGNVDAVATLEADHSEDVAFYFDPDTGETRGGTYGAFVSAPISPALAPFIQGRTQDDPRDSKRVEVYRLAQADGQAAVRLRFATAGTDSWYWGIDNVGLYSIPPVLPPTIGVPPTSQTAYEGDPVRFTVTVNGIGPFTYRWLHEGNPIPNATTADLTLPRVAFAQAGEYQVEVRNDAGPTLSEPATLAVLAVPGVFTGAWDFDGGNLERSVGVGTLEYADAEVTAGLTTFETSDDTNVPHISGQPAKYMRVPAFDDPTQGYALTMPSQPVPGEGYLNRYTMAWDALIVNDLNWTPFFNSDPNNNNDADFYADDTGALGIGALGYSADAVVEPGRWYRIVFAANLVAGRVTVYVDGLPVHTRTGGSLANGRFALYTDRDPGPDIRLFNEGDPSGQYTHELLVNSFAFTSCELSRDQIAALGGPSASGIRLPIPILFQPPVIANDQVSLAWTGGTGPFAVQKKNRLSDAWQTVATSDARSFTETATGQTAFYRIIEP